MKENSGKFLSDKDSAAIMTALNTAGIFVTCGLQSPNVMVTHLGAVGTLWGRQIFALPIRSSKFSYRIVKETKSFALNVPARDMRTEISLCDTISGFKVNKFETLNLLPQKAKSIESYVLSECGLIVEYKVIAIIPPENIDAQIENLFNTSRPHTLFIGEVANSYRLR